MPIARNGLEDMPLSSGSRLGHYDVTALIGEGGMGQVYRAQVEGEGNKMNLNAAAVVGAVMVALVLLGVMIFNSAIS